MNYILRNPALAITLISLLLTSFHYSNRLHTTAKARTTTTTPSCLPGISRADTTRHLKNAPDFTLEDMNGEPFTLSEQEGKVVVLNIWATWCGPCRKEIPDFIEIQKEMRDEGVLFVGVSLDEEGFKAVRPFAQEYGVNYPLLVDDGSVFKGYGPFRGIPMTFIINKKGKVERVAPGVVNIKALKFTLKKLARR